LKPQLFIAGKNSDFEGTASSQLGTCYFEGTASHSWEDAFLKVQLFIVEKKIILKVQLCITGSF